MTHGNIKDMSGMVFKRLTVIALDHIGGKNGSAFWRCQCICGVVAIVNGANLRSGMTGSCGCLQRAKTQKMLIEKGRFNGRPVDIETVLARRLEDPDDDAKILDEEVKDR